jgi:hypothetical protein
MDKLDADVAVCFPFQSGAYRVPLRMYQGMFMLPGWMDKISQSVHVLCMYTFRPAEL